jgi:hypothetical protein
MLKKYFERENEKIATAVVFEDDSQYQGDSEELNLHTVEDYTDCNINTELDGIQKEQLMELLHKYGGIFSSLPGHTSLAEHNIELYDDTPIRSKPYPVPYNMYPQLKREIDEMKRLGIIEESNSPYCSPIIMIKKKDNSFRLVADMRKLNKITIFDCEPMPDPDAIFAKLSGNKFFSKLDFCKGYWQIPVKPEHRTYTAFSTPFGNFQFKMMPFGLTNAGQTYNRMMRKLLLDLLNTDSFVDDVLTYSTTWEKHLEQLEELFKVIQGANLKIKPKKCYFGFYEVEFLGHVVDSKFITVQDDKVEKLKNAEKPKTKKQLKSFLGLANYYRKFIPHFAERVKSLTDLTKKGYPNALPWREEHTEQFEALKKALCEKPILRLPDLDREFVLQTDASDIGIGAMLAQEYDGKLLPILYISKKLNKAETNYSTIEKECLAIIWAVNRLQVYLLGRQFCLQTDHNSLSFLEQKRYTNSKIMRWSLALQQYNFKVVSIKGNENRGADYLSRL